MNERAGAPGDHDPSGGLPGSALTTVGYQEKAGGPCDGGGGQAGREVETESGGSGG